MSEVPINYEDFMKRQVYDWAAYIGSGLRGVDKSTIANIISTFQSIPDPEEAVLLTIAYIKRQEARGEIKSKPVAKNLVYHLYLLFKNFKNNKEQLRNAVNKYLILSKWIFDTNPKIDLKDFNAFINFTIKK